MPNHVSNKLEIHCEDEVIMNKMKMMMFDLDENKNQIFTLRKMLPLPDRFSGNEEYSEYGYYWCLAMWGTKWDVYNYKISESGDTIYIYYDTAWSPNDNWVELFCMYINKNLSSDNSIHKNGIYVKLNYSCYMSNFGGIFHWVPFSKPKEKSLSIMEYAKEFNQSLYESLVELDEFRRS